MKQDKISLFDLDLESKRFQSYAKEVNKCNGRII